MLPSDRRLRRANSTRQVSVNSVGENMFAITATAHINHTCEFVTRIIKWESERRELKWSTCINSCYTYLYDSLLNITSVYTAIVLGPVRLWWCQCYLMLPFERTMMMMMTSSLAVPVFVWVWMWYLLHMFTVYRCYNSRQHSHGISRTKEHVRVNMLQKASRATGSVGRSTDLEVNNPFPVSKRMWHCGIIYDVGSVKLATHTLQTTVIVHRMHVCGLNGHLEACDRPSN